MIDTCAHVRRFAPHPAATSEAAPLVRWTEEWYSAAGQGVVAGLLDTGCDEQVPDLVDADLVTRNFAATVEESACSAEHGTYSVAILVGQGRHQIRGIAPRARLFIAKVVDAAGVATPRAVIEAIEWLVSSGVQIIVLPLGEPIEREEISRLIEKAYEHGICVFAAAGNGHPELLVYPARHPHAIAVGAADARGTLLRECSRLPRLDLVAPGWQIPAPIRGRVIRRRSGSSVACVIAAAVAILALSAGAIPKRTMSRMNILTTLRGGGLAELSR